MGCVPSCMFIIVVYSSLDRHLGCFQIWVTMNKIMSSLVQMFVEQAFLPEEENWVSQIASVQIYCVRNF